MKRIVMVLAVAALFQGSQVLAEDAPIVLISKSTYADRHAGDLGMGNAAAAFPGEAREDPIVLVSQWTHADRSADKVAAVSAYPGFAREDPIVVESKSTYASERLARGAMDPAAAE